MTIARAEFLAFRKAIINKATEELKKDISCGIITIPKEDKEKLKRRLGEEFSTLFSTLSQSPPQGTTLTSEERKIFINNILIDIKILFDIEEEQDKGQKKWNEALKNYTENPELGFKDISHSLLLQNKARLLSETLKTVITSPQFFKIINLILKNKETALSFINTANIRIIHAILKNNPELLHIDHLYEGLIGRLKHDPHEKIIKLIIDNSSEDLEKINIARNFFKYNRNLAGEAIATINEEGVIELAKEINSNSDIATMVIYALATFKNDTKVARALFKALQLEPTLSTDINFNIAEAIFQKLSCVEWSIRQTAIANINKAAAELGGEAFHIAEILTEKGSIIPYTRIGDPRAVITEKISTKEIYKYLSSIKKESGFICGAYEDGLIFKYRISKINFPEDMGDCLTTEEYLGMAEGFLSKKDYLEITVTQPTGSDSEEIILCTIIDEEGKIIIKNWKDNIESERKVKINDHLDSQIKSIATKIKILNMAEYLIDLKKTKDRRKFDSIECGIKTTIPDFENIVVGEETVTIFAKKDGKIAIDTKKGTITSNSDLDYLNPTLQFLINAHAANKTIPSEEDYLLEFADYSSLPELKKNTHHDPGTSPAPQDVEAASKSSHTP